MSTKTDIDIAIIRKRLDAFPMNTPPADGYVQDWADTTFVPAGAVTSWVVAREIIIPAQKRAVIRKFAIDGNTPAAAFFIRFRFVVNGSPTLNYQAPPYTFGNVSMPTEIWIVVPQQNTVQLQLQNLDQTIGYQVNSRVVCWSWNAVALVPGLEV